MLQPCQGLLFGGLLYSAFEAAGSGCRRLSARCNGSYSGLRRRIHDNTPSHDHRAFSPPFRPRCLRSLFLKFAPFGKRLVLLIQRLPIAWWSTNRRKALLNAPDITACATAPSSPRCSAVRYAGARRRRSPMGAVRADSRRMAVRTALGAAPLRVVPQILTGEPGAGRRQWWTRFAAGALEHGRAGEDDFQRTGRNGSPASRSASGCVQDGDEDELPRQRQKV